MKHTHFQLFLLVNISLVTIGLNLASAQEAGEYDYAYAEDVQPRIINCYTCVSHVRDGHASGLHSCGEPFRNNGIPEVECQGPCAKIYHNVGDGEHTLHRACLPNCKENEDENGFTTCCYNDLCNGATSSGGIGLRVTLISFSVLMFTYFYTRLL